MKANKNKKNNFDLSNLKFAAIIMLAVSVHKYIGNWNYSNVFGDQNLQGRRTICLSIGVISASANRSQRDVIRESWGKSGAVCRLRFFIATNKEWEIVEKVVI